MDDKEEKNVCIKIPFLNNQQANIVYEVLNVDKELKGSGVTRILEIDGVNLTLKFISRDLKRLRTSINATLKNIKLIVKTIQCLSI